METLTVQKIEQGRQANPGAYTWLSTERLKTICGDDTEAFKRLTTLSKGLDDTYTEGLNICPQPWNDEGCAGGLYACELRHLFEWIHLYPDITEVAWVDVPADAHVARFDTKIKASRLILKRTDIMIERPLYNPVTITTDPDNDGVHARAWTMRMLPCTQDGMIIPSRPPL